MRLQNKCSHNINLKFPPTYSSKSPPIMVFMRALLAKLTFSANKNPSTHQTNLLSLSTPVKVYFFCIIFILVQHICLKSSNIFWEKNEMDLVITRTYVSILYFLSTFVTHLLYFCTLLYFVAPIRILENCVDVLRIINIVFKLKLKLTNMKPSLPHDYIC